MDMEKAFDRMEWGFLLAIMEKLGFNPIWIHWIRICITSSSFSILLNGSPFGFFSPERGLRQGDPLSPFLFILGSEVFSRLMFREESLGSIKGLQISRNCSAIHHLLFADDLLIFGKATISEASCIKSCLDKYCYWSGQSINPAKSSIRFSKNTFPATSSAISNIIPYPSNPSNSLYLGLPILMGNSKKRAFQGIIDKVHSRIDGWRAKTLSQAGRLVLIKSVAAALPSYAMSSFLLPISTSTDLDRIFKKFWWGFPPKKARNLSLKAWDSICFPKELGGLGIRKMREVNLALISKLGWKLLSNADSMWVAQLRGKYLHSSTFLSPSPHSSSSWLWQGIIKSLPFISQGACHRIHSSSSLPIWSSSWIPTLPSFTPSPSSFLVSPFPNLIVSDLFLQNLNSPHLSWNFPLVYHLFDSSSVMEIAKISIYPATTEKFIWTPSSNGLFSTKSAYKLISSSRSLPNSPLAPKQWKLLWNLKLNDRLKLFLWKIAWDIIPSKTRLNAVFPIPPADLFCPLCNVEEDSLSHLFFRCFFARVSWRYSHWPLDSMKWSSLSLSDWIKGILSPHQSFGIPLADSHLFQIYAVVLCDMLWFSRNQVVHKGVFPDVSILAGDIKRISLEHFAAWNSISTPVRELWSPPPAGSFKVNFDTTIRDLFSVQAAVCRNSQGIIVKALSQVRPPCDPTFGEAQAALLAASLIVSLHLKNFILEGDSSIVISSLQHLTIVLDWKIEHVISDTISLLPISSIWEARKVHRSANFCALHVAYRAAARVISNYIPSLFSPPISIPICSGKDPPFAFSSF
ncbi:uncharacterized protein LOC132189495 [Corylus avellana]|uniref:uncharacterized protein LOC132189495 n=1 Tax=Corylus avellana TaxID=13451 RepID=UPI00286CED5B|nr:uncharacterized protein LOC132189495 [Corylus avellana]